MYLKNIREKMYGIRDKGMYVYAEHNLLSLHAFIAFNFFPLKIP